MFGKKDIQDLSAMCRKVIRASGTVICETFVDHPTTICFPQYGLRVKEIHHKVWYTIASVSYHTEKSRLIAIKAIESAFEMRTMPKLPTPIDLSEPGSYVA